MSVQMDPCYLKMGVDPNLTITPNWSIDVSDIRTVKVSNISLAATEQDIKEFFSFSGDIEYIEMQSESERSQLAYVTFKDSQGADTATLLSGATIVDHSVDIMPVEYYQLPPEAYTQTSGRNTSSADSAVKKAEDVVSSMLAKGFVLGKDALNRAKSLDERHHITSQASATLASLDHRVGLTDKLSAVTGKVREVDERFLVSEITKSALAEASSAGSAILSNAYVSKGTSWLSGAVNRVTKAAVEVGTMTREKVDRAEEERKEIVSREKKGMVSEFAQLHLDESTMGEAPEIRADSVDERRLQIM